MVQSALEAWHWWTIVLASKKQCPCRDSRLSTSLFLKTLPIVFAYFTVFAIGKSEWNHCATCTHTCTAAYLAGSVHVTIDDLTWYTTLTTYTKVVFSWNWGLTYERKQLPTKLNGWAQGLQFCFMEVCKRKMETTLNLWAWYASIIILHQETPIRIILPS